jgi:hypothetical protein
LTRQANRQALNKNGVGRKTMASQNQNGSNTMHLILAWGFVGIPLAWGVIQTLQNAMKLFQ